MFMSVPSHRSHARPLRREAGPPKPPAPPPTVQKAAPDMPAAETTEFAPEDGADIVSPELSSPDDISGFVTLLDATLEGEQDG